MSEEKKPKKNKPSDDEKSEHSEEPRFEPSPDDADDRFLISHQPLGAEAPPVASGSGAISSGAGLSRLLRRISPFKPKDSSKATKPSSRKLKKESSFTKARNALRRTLRKSEPIIRPPDPETEEMRRRKVSDPTHSKKIEPIVEVEVKSKKSLFGRWSGSKEATPKVKNEAKKKSKEARKKAKDEKKSKRRRFESKDDFGESFASTSICTFASDDTVKKTALSARSSNQPSVGHVSVGFYNEFMVSESSGNPTESTSLDMKSGSDTPDVLSRRSTFNKRPRSSREPEDCAEELEDDRDELDDEEDSSESSD